MCGYRGGGGGGGVRPPPLKNGVNIWFHSYLGRDPLPPEKSQSYQASIPYLVIIDPLAGSEHEITKKYTSQTTHQPQNTEPPQTFGGT